MGVATRLRSNKNDLQDTPIKLKTFFNPVKIQTLVLPPFRKGHSTKITGGLDSKSELWTTYSLWKKYQLYLSTYVFTKIYLINYRRESDSLQSVVTTKV